MTERFPGGLRVDGEHPPLRPSPLGSPPGISALTPRGGGTRAARGAEPDGQGFARVQVKRMVE